MLFKHIKKYIAPKPPQPYTMAYLDVKSRQNQKKTTAVILQSWGGPDLELQTPAPNPKKKVPRSQRASRALCLGATNLIFEPLTYAHFRLTFTVHRLGAWAASAASRLVAAASTRTRRAARAAGVGPEPGSQVFVCRAYPRGPSTSLIGI